MSLSLLFVTPVFLSVTVLVCPSRWPTGWTTAAQGPFRQNWLWHSRHWRSAVHYSVCFFHLLPFSSMLYFFLSPSCSHSHICYSAFPSSLIVTLVQSKSFLCTQCFSLLSFTTDNSWLSHLLNVFLVAAKMCTLTLQVLVMLCALSLKCLWSHLRRLSETFYGKIHEFLPHTVGHLTNSTHNTKHWLNTTYSSSHAIHLAQSSLADGNCFKSLVFVCVNVLLSPAGFPWGWPFVDHNELCLPAGWDAGQGGVVDVAGTQPWTHGSRVQEPP